MRHEDDAADVVEDRRVELVVHRAVRRHQLDADDERHVDGEDRDDRNHSDDARRALGDGREPAEQLAKLQRADQLRRHAHQDADDEMLEQHVDEHGRREVREGVYLVGELFVVDHLHHVFDRLRPLVVRVAGVDGGADRQPLDERHRVDDVHHHVGAHVHRLLQHVEQVERGERDEEVAADVARVLRHVLLQRRRQDAVLRLQPADVREREDDRDLREEVGVRVVGRQLDEDVARVPVDPILLAQLAQRQPNVVLQVRVQYHLVAAAQQRRLIEVGQHPAVVALGVVVDPRAVRAGRARLLRAG